MTQYTDEHEFIESLIVDRFDKSEVKQDIYEGLSPIGDYSVSIEQSGDIYITATHAQAADVAYILSRIKTTRLEQKQRNSPFIATMGMISLLVIIATGIGSTIGLFRTYPKINQPTMEQSK